jgi:hypothetical protein
MVIGGNKPWRRAPRGTKSHIASELVAAEFPAKKHIILSYADGQRLRGFMHSEF